MATKSATGLEIGQRKPLWRIGKIIGQGACGSVHLLESIDGSSDVTYAIKVAPIPDDSIPAKKKKALKHNADLLHYENLIYTSHLPKLRGVYIPQLPLSKGPPSTGVVEGFRYLVMEQMEAPFWDIIHRLIDTSKSATINVGPVATQLFNICQRVHEHQLLVIDIKPENFMLTKTNTKALEKQIRMIDLGLMQTYGSLGGHRPNEHGGMVGTPMYASLNLHEGSTASRRDDLEAIGYVIAEMCMRIMATMRAEKNLDTLLPWSQGKSDEEIQKVKEACMTKPNSPFFSSLGAEGNRDLETRMREYFSSVRSMTYKQTPDYDTLSELLSGLKVEITTTKKRVEAKAKAPTTKITTNNATVNATMRLGKASDARTDAAVVSTRRTRASKRAVEKEENALAKKLHLEEMLEDKSMEEVDSDDGTFLTTNETDTSFLTCDQGEQMEWDPVEDSYNQNRIGVKILFTGGPHEGESVILAKGERVTLTIGADPSESDGYSIVGDSEVDKSHVRLVLHATKKLKTLMLTDLKSAMGTRVNGAIVKKEQKLFINDSVNIGESSFKIVPISENELQLPAIIPTRVVKNKNREDVAGLIGRVDGTEAVIAKENQNPAAVANGDCQGGVTLVFIGGPYKEQSIELMKGQNESIVLGAKSRSGSKVSFPMSKDSSISTQVRIELETTKTFFTVVVTDLMSSSGTSVNGSKLQKGKGQKAFLNDEIVIGNSAIKIKKI